MHDVLVIGGGHNGLAAAALLAKAGERVLLLERWAAPGGIAASEEFAPGYRSCGLLHDTCRVRDSLVQQLDLPRFGLRRDPGPPAVFAIGPNAGRGLFLSHDPEVAASEIMRAAASREAGERDVAAYRAYRAFWREVRPALAPLLSDLPPEPGDLELGRLLSIGRKLWPLRRLGPARMMDVLRAAPQSVQDFLSDRFESPLLCSALAGAALVGDRWGPRAPGTNAQLLAHEVTAGGAVAGGPAALAKCLAAAAQSAGVQVRTDAAVAAILTESATSPRAVGVRLAGGEEIRAKTVLAACGPQRALLELIPRHTLAPDAEQRLRQFRARGACAVLRLALRGRLEFGGRPGERIEFARVADGLDDWERAADAVKHRRIAETPVLDVSVPTISDESLAPAGCDVVNIIIYGAPCDLAAGWTSDAQRTLLERAVDVLSRVCIDLRDRLAAHELLTPRDLEQRYGLCGGHLLHGEQSLDQWLVRPTPDCGRYATPVSGLYVTGGATWPGGGITGAPGLLAAKRILSG